MEEMAAELSAALEGLKVQQNLLSEKQNERTAAAEELAKAEEAYREKLEINRKQLAEKEKLTADITHEENEIARLTAEKEKAERSAEEAAAALKELEKQIHDLISDEEKNKKEMNGAGGKRKSGQTLN